MKSLPIIYKLLSINLVILIGMLSIISSSGGGGGSNDNNSPSGTPANEAGYNPFIVGLTKSWKTTTSSSYGSQTIYMDEEYKENLTIVHDSNTIADTGNYSSKGTAYLSSDDGHLGVYKIVQSNNDGGSSTMRSSPSQPLYEPAPEIGSKDSYGPIHISTTYSGGSSSGTLSLSYEVLALESVTVPAGTFENALKVRLKSTTDGDISVQSQWYVKGLGLVKWTISYEGTTTKSVLTSFSGDDGTPIKDDNSDGGNNNPDDDAGSGPGDIQTWYKDADSDGYGDPKYSLEAISQPPGYVLNRSDCDDNNALINPSKDEISYNGVNDDCDANTPDDDLDGDGYSIDEDCIDTDATVHVGSAEICGDGIDQNCDGIIDNNCNLLIASDSNSNGFGCSVSIFGDYMVVGASTDQDKGFSAGAVYIFKRSGTEWVEIEKLTPRDYSKDYTVGAYFGRSVSLFDKLLIVGAYRWGYGTYNRGAAFIYSIENDDVIELKRFEGGYKNDSFGNAVSISGDNVIIGARSADHHGTGYNFSAYGAAYVTEKSDAGWTWAKAIDFPDIYCDGAGFCDLAPTRVRFNFGISVSVSGDYAIVGSSPYFQDTDLSPTGAAYIFRRVDSDWVYFDKLKPSDIDSTTFGSSVSISGDYVVVGSSNAAYVFKLIGNDWVEDEILKASDEADGSVFGIPVAISGNNVIVGSKNVPFHDNGAAYLFQRNGDNWPEIYKFAPENIKGEDSYGSSIAISGSYVAVGAKEKVFYYNLNDL